MPFDYKNTEFANQYDLLLTRNACEKLLLNLASKCKEDIKNGRNGELPSTVGIIYSAL